MIRRFGVTFTATSRTAVPLIAALAGVLLLDETVTPLTIIGGLILIAGVVVVNRASTATQSEVPSLRPAAALLAQVSEM
jgi:drug/metabolite transporter (DMT)-like permease